MFKMVSIPTFSWSRNPIKKGTTFQPAIMTCFREISVSVSALNVSSTSLSRHQYKLQIPRSTERLLASLLRNEMPRTEHSATAYDVVWCERDDI